MGKKGCSFGGLEGGKHRPVKQRALTQEAAQLGWHMASSFIQHAKVFSLFTPSHLLPLPISLSLLLMQNDS